jgi:hypothetical protein
MALRAPGLKFSTHLVAAPMPAILSLGTNSLALLTRKTTASSPATIHRVRFSVRFMRFVLIGLCATSASEPEVVVSEVHVRAARATRGVFVSAVRRRNLSECEAARQPHSPVRCLVEREAIQSPAAG